VLNYCTRVPHKKVLSDLRSRVKQLERLLEEHGIEIPSDGEQGAGGSLNFGVLQGQTTSRTGTRPTDESLSAPGVPPPLAEVAGRVNGSLNPQQLLTPSTADDTSSSGGDSMTNDLAAQMGSLKVAEDGQLRYYGPTSNLHIIHNGLFSLSRSTIRSVTEEGQLALQRAGVGQHVDPEIESHLTRLYFAWEDPAIHVVDEEMYYTEKNNWSLGATGTPFYSETLNNAM
jgi:hypothetical protein